MRSTDNILLSTQCSTVNCRCYAVQQISRTYSSCITENSYLLNTRFPLPWVPRNHHSVLISMSLTMLDSSYKWNVVFVPLRLHYFSEYNTLQVHPCFHNGRISSFFKGWIIFHCKAYFFFFSRRKCLDLSKSQPCLKVIIIFHPVYTKCCSLRMATRQ